MTRDRSPRLARWLLGVCLPVDEREGILGDLEEDYAAAREIGSSAAWYWFQALGLVWRFAVVRVAERMNGARSGRANRVRAQPGHVVAAGLRRLIRGFRLRPILSLGVVLAFALGIGANAAMYGMAERVLLRAPDHVTDASGVRRVFVDRFIDYAGDRITTSLIAYADVEDLRSAPGFSDVAAYTSVNELVTGRGLDATDVDAVYATAELFPLLGVRAAIGRFYDTSEDRPGAAGTAVISWGFWQDQFGGDPNVIGRALDVGRGEVTILGVAPRGFTGAELRRVDVWLPLRTNAIAEVGDEWETTRGTHWVHAVVRLNGDAPSAAIEQATTLHRSGRAAQIGAGTYDADARVVLTDLVAAHAPNAGLEVSVATWLAGVALIVLLIACANVVNLMLASAMRAHRETSVRIALGASRWRLVSEALVEGIGLATVAALVAIGLAAWVSRFLRPVLLPDIAWNGYHTLAQIAGVALVSGVLAGFASTLVPALRAAGARFTATSHVGAAPIARRLRSGLVVIQSALSVVLLIGAGLFLLSLNRARGVALGFDPHDLIVLRPVFDGPAPEGVQAYELFGDAARTAVALPGVIAASEARSVPFRSSFSVGLAADGTDSIPRLPGGGPYLNVVGRGYFAVMGTRVVEGRGFDDTDTPSSTRVAIVDAVMASALWPGSSAIGRCLRIGGATASCTTVVGVVERAHRDGITEPDAMSYYITSAQRTYTSIPPEALMVRLTADTGATVALLKERLAALDPRIRYVQAQLITDFIEPQMRAWSLGATLFTAFGVLALLVAATGLYSVLSFDVAQRVREIGLRAALGARPRALVSLVTSRAMVLTSAGIAVGGIIAFLAAPRAADLLFQTDSRDPVIFGAVASGLIVVGMLAAAIPALRAARVDPNVALRADS